MISRYSLTASLLIAFLFAIGLALPAQAQHPTAVTSIVNNEADTSLEVNHNGSLLAPGDLVTDGTENDSIPVEGGGTRLMWYPEKAAFRVGRVELTEWDAKNIGDYSVAMGFNTTASGRKATAIGDGTIANSRHATAMGHDSEAIEVTATAMGLKTTASGNYATAMGQATTASGDVATAMGLGTTASGTEATAMNHFTIAASDNSLSMGEYNSANTSSDNTLFVAGNGLPDSRSDALVLKENGNLGIEGAFRADLAGGTWAGHFQGSKSGSAGNPANHIAFVENGGGTNSDGLALLAGPNDNPGSAVNYLTFYDGDGDPIGGIQGNGSGGIERVSGSGDFAEELPVAKGAETPEAAELVGVRERAVSLSTADADRVMIASRAPILTGNATPATKEDDARRVAVAFVGQVPAKVRGSVEVGDLIVASGQNDGTARAVAPSEYRRPEHGPIAGQAWSAKETSGVGEVTVAVGLGRSGAVAEQLEEQRKTNQKQRAQIEDLKKRLAALETERSSAAVAGLASSRISLFLAFVLGGLLGAGLLWRRRS